VIKSASHNPSPHQQESILKKETLYKARDREKKSCIEARRKLCMNRHRITYSLMISEPSIKVQLSERGRQRQRQRPFRGGETQRETCILFSALEKLFNCLQEAVFDATANTTVGQFHPLLH
jgi:hypothetical protein